MSDDVGVDDTTKVSHCLTVFDTNQFYMKYPFSAHADAGSTAFADFVPLNGRMF